LHYRDFSVNIHLTRRDILSLEKNPKFVKLCPEVRNLLSLKLGGTIPATTESMYQKLQRCAADNTCSCLAILINTPACEKSLRKLEDLRKLIQIFEDLRCRETDPP
jgi:hypothetical protein